ncbi:5'-deoxyadenosine deaminase-like protein [Cladobotryum mycophilum]|uniref:5'-deoxyadenosine deaminase-like protein n=1 Tax=Cladobotryum mycophilum TaxID=491253 RepID=A0ABR0SRE1_9HYPO
MESVDAGTTTVIDHAHMNYSPENNKEAIRATIASGIRSTFCYCAHPRVTTWKPELNITKDLFPDWSISTFKELASMQPFGPNGRVRLGFAMDIMYVPPAVLKDTYAMVRGYGVHLITSHVSRIRAVHSSPSAITVLHNNALLGPDVLLAHANQASTEELNYLKKSGAHLSSTPLSEMQMGHGHPICLRDGFAGISSIGTDSNGICTSYIPAQMRIVLQDTRAQRTEDRIQKGLSESAVGPTVEDVYNLGTLLGAEAIGLHHEIGSLRVGKKADIVIFNGRSPSMISVSERNPIAGIVLFSSERDVQTVIVDGVIQKDDFSPKPVSIPEDIQQREDVNIIESKSLGWWEVAAKLDESRKRLEVTRAEAVDEKLVREALIKSFSSISVTTDSK